MAGRIRKVRPSATPADRDRYYRTSTLPDGPVVYFIRAGEFGPIKIGYAFDLRQRLNVLQTGNHLELRVIGWIVGGTRALERQLHRQFAHECIRGEWFCSARELLDLVSQKATR